MHKNRETWIKHIQNYKSSGLTAAKWCEQNGINIYTLKYHITKINKEKKQQESNQTKWAAVIPNSCKTTKTEVQPIKITIGNSTIEVTRGFDPTAFETVVRSLIKQC